MHCVGCARETYVRVDYSTVQVLLVRDARVPARIKKNYSGLRLSEDLACHILARGVHTDKTLTEILN